MPRELVLGDPNKPHLTPGVLYARLVVGGVDLQVYGNSLQSLEHELYADGQQGKLSMVLFDPDYDVIEDVLIQGRESAVFEYGWANGPRSGERSGVVLTYRPRFGEKGAYLDITITDFALLSQTSSSNEIHVGRISDVVRKLATRNQLEPVVEDTDDEPSEWEQDNLTDLVFINTKLKPRARSSQKRGGYEMRTDGSRLYFQTPQFGGGIRRRYLFSRDRMGEVIEFSPSYNGAAMLVHGGGNIRVEGYDHLEKRVVRTDVSLDKPPEMVRMQPETTPTSSGEQRYYSLPFRKVGDVERWAESKWTRARYDAWTADLEVMGDPTIAPADLLEVVLLKTDGDWHYTSGVYRVVRSTQRMREGRFTTSCEMQTDGSRFDAADTAGTTVPLNLADVSDGSTVSVTAEAEA